MYLLKADEHQQLRELLVQLQNGLIDSIRFGEIEEVESLSQKRLGALDGFCIRWISTPGGNQFAIKTMHFGIEGSGDYCGKDIDFTITRCASHASHYMRPASARLQSIRARLGRPSQPRMGFSPVTIDGHEDDQIPSNRR